MRVGFAGTPLFAATALEAMLGAGFSVELVLTQPDRPRGRGMKPSPGPVKALAASRGIPIVQPATLKSEWSTIVPIPLDVLVVAAYGLIVPAPMLAWPRHGCLNIHASLLPRWRGAAPIARAILAGDEETGISIMRMDRGLDTGCIISQHRLGIEAHETAGSLHDKLAPLGAHAIVDTLASLQRGESLRCVPQVDAAASYAAKIERNEATIDWHADARAIDRAVRAFNPWPGAQVSFDGAALKIWRAMPLRGRFGSPGTVVRVDGSGIVIACGEGALAIAELQRASGKRMSASAFAAGHRFELGAPFGGAPIESGGPGTI